MKVVALCNKLSRSRSAKLRGDDLDVNGSGDGLTLGILNAEIVAKTSPQVSNMAQGKKAVEVCFLITNLLFIISSLILTNNLII